MNESNVRNVVIIGSGPAGLTSALYASRAELKPVVFMGLNPGGQLMQTTEVENFPGFPEGIQGPDLMQNMMKQVERFGTEMLAENVVSVDFSKKPLVVKGEKTEIQAKSVIIATGAEANWLGLENEQRFRGHGVSACATCDGFFFRGKDIVVIGGGDSAMEEANFLTKFANKVYLIHRKTEFKASKIMLKRAQENPKIEFVTPFQVVDVLGTDNVTGVKIKNTENGEEKELSVQGMFLAIGHTPVSKIFKDSGIETNEVGYIKTTNHTHTNIEGVFMAGDVGDPRYRQAVTAAGLGCMAALDAEKYLTESGE